MSTTSEPAESSDSLAKELNIRIKFNAYSQSPDDEETEDINIIVHEAPGVVDRFESTSRSDATAAASSPSSCAPSSSRPTPASSS
jgi:hypothetical protein